MSELDTRTLSGDLWLGADDVRRRLSDHLSSQPSARLSMDVIALEAFGVEAPNRSVRSQIGIALTGLGWRRVEQRTKKPRYMYERA
jgi:hypothetical protein